MVQQPPKRKTRRQKKAKFSCDSYFELDPANDNQESAINAIKNSSQTLLFGPAGTGKTYIPATLAASMYKCEEVDKIIITRPHVAVGKDIGYLKGSKDEKCLPWALPVVDILEKHLGPNTVENDIKNGNIELVPLALIRGRSFDNSFIIVDEAQNITIEELKAVLTRMGENSKLVLDGDIQQSDLKVESGLKVVIEIIQKYDLPVPIVEFGVDDIVRSEETKMWIEAFLKEGI